MSSCKIGELFDPREILPTALHGFLTITEVDDAGFLVGPLFQQKFGESPPGEPRHIVCLYRDSNNAQHVVGYSHMRPFGDVYLSGGSCTSGDTLRRMQPQEREIVDASGGIWFHLLKYAFRKYADCCDAFFGHCGNPRALEVALAAGFIKTGHEPIIVNWHKPLHETFKRALLAKVVALGPF
ncbi:MAG: hypothetical protein JSS33_10025 [Proteobacteria bacterium]|nr:hypothetical protein [Pseudomonadota bacterium]